MAKKGNEIKFPSEEKYELASQLKSALVSVPANIAEGCRRQHTKELAYLLSVALGSLSEVRYYFLLCKDIGYLSEEAYNELQQECIDIDKMLDSLILKIKNQLNESI